MAEPIYLTQQGIEKIKEELEHLRQVERANIAKRLRAAIEMGDLSENADYIKAKEDQGFVEGKIQELEATLNNVEIIQKNTLQDGIIKIGSHVMIKEEGYEEERIQIVGSKEADPPKGKLSYESPIGSALLGHQIGDIVRVETPGGYLNFKIKEIK